MATPKISTPKRGAPLPQISKAKASSTGRSPSASQRSRGAGGQFLPVILSPTEEAERAEAAEGRRLLKFSDVLEALENNEDVGAAIEEMRAALLYNANPIVRLKLKPSAMAEALGKGSSIQHRIGAGDFGAPLRAIPSQKAAPAPKKKTDTNRFLA